MFCQGLLSILLTNSPFPSSSQAVLLPPGQLVSRGRGALCSSAQQHIRSGARLPSLGQGAQQGPVVPLGAGLASTTTPAVKTMAKMMPLLYLPSQGADDQGPYLTRQLQIRQSYFLQVLYEPFGKTALNLHRVTSCTGGLYNFTGSRS